MRMPMRTSLFLLPLLLISCSHSNLEKARTPAQDEKKPAPSFLENVNRYSLEQLAGFSDDTLVDRLNSPDWAWLWQKPVMTIDEVERRTSKSKEKALSFTQKFIDSFLYHKDIRGTEVHSLFLHVFAQAGPPQEWNSEWQDLGRRLERLGRVLYQAQDRGAVVEAKQQYQRHFVEGAKLRATFQGKKSYIDFLQSLSADRELEWVAKDSDLELVQLVKQLFELGSEKEYPILLSLFLQFESQLDKAIALEKLFALNPTGMRDLVLKRIDLFSENSAPNSIAVEIEILKKWSPKSLPQILPKVHLLVKSAEAKKDLAGKVALLAAIGTEEGKKEMTWAQLYPGRLDNSSCIVSGEILADFYHRRLMKPKEVVTGITALSNCEDNEVREKLSTVIVSLCKEAQKQKDVTVLKPCVKDLFYPMALWSLKTQSKVAKENARELFELIPEKWKRALPRKCRLGMFTPDVYDSAGKIIWPESLNYFYLTEAGLTTKSCKELDASQLMFLSKSRSGSYLQKEGKGVEFVADLLGDNRLQMSTCFQSILSDPKFPGMVAKLSMRGKDRTRNISFILEEYATFPEAKGGFVDSCSR